MVNAAQNPPPRDTYGYYYWLKRQVQLLNVPAARAPTPNLVAWIRARAGWRGLALFVVLLWSCRVPPYQPQYEGTLSPPLIAEMKLGEPPSGFHPDPPLSDTLAPANNDLALAAAVLRSYCVETSANLSPHISTAFSRSLEKTQRLLDTGNTELQRRLDDRNGHISNLSATLQLARECVRRSTKPMSYTWFGGIYDFAFASAIALHGKMDGPAIDAIAKSLANDSGTNVTVPKPLIWEAYRILGHKAQLLAVADLIDVGRKAERQRATALVAQAEDLAAELEYLVDAIREFVDIDPADVLGNAVRHGGEGVFRLVPWSGPLLRWAMPRLLRWSTAVDKVALAIVAGGIEGHTLAVVEEIRAAADLYETCDAGAEYDRSVSRDRDIVGVVGAVGVSGQRISEAAAVVSDAAVSLIRHQEEEARRISGHLGAVFVPLR